MIRLPWRRRLPQEPGLSAHDGRTGPPASATHYATLGLTREARATDIVRAYRRLAKHHHPDVSADTAGADAFKRASVAYEVLWNPARRSAYDASLDAAAAAVAPNAASRPNASRGETTMFIALAVLACVGLLYVLVYAFGSRGDGQAGAPPIATPAPSTAAPSPSVAQAAGGLPNASASSSPARGPTTSSPAQSTPLPATPSPTAVPTLSPTLTPTPPPSPTAPPVTQSPPTQPPPTATPTATPTRCVVPSVIGLRKNAVQPAWVSAGFTTLVTFLGPAGNYVVGMQTPVAGTTGPCATTDLTVGP